MSLILEALKRAERERQDLENPLPIIESSTESSIQDANRPEILPEKKSFHRHWILLIVIVGSILVGFFMSRAATINTPPATSVNHSRDLIDPTSVITETVVPQSSIAHSSRAIDQTLTDLYQQKPSSLPKVQDVQVAQLYAENTTVSSGSIESQSLEAVSVAVTNPLPDMNEQLPKNLRTESDLRRIADTDAMAFDDLSFNQKQLFPSISYSQHNYLGNSASSVVINGELMRVGSRITQDLTIEEVVEDGVIFNFYHKRVSFKALSGWINM